ncbi:hypothetical protein [Streptomyces europaeiscabiei]|uniref:hypothetical protein n=1 Tax=Streptomyces europaeiscabiei TaxID=146819 RepID=UPI0030B94AA6
MRIRTSALTALAVAALAAGTVLTAPAAGAATKAAAPTFLSASQLPPHPTSSWTAGPVTEGFPEALGLCVSTEGVLDYDYRHREFRTDLDTSAVQLTVVTGTAGQAKDHDHGRQQAVLTRRPPERARGRPPATGGRRDGPVPVFVLHFGSALLGRGLFRT